GPAGHARPGPGQRRRHLLRHLRLRRRLLLPDRGGAGGDEHLHLRRDDDRQLPPRHLPGVAAPPRGPLLPPRPRPLPPPALSPAPSTLGRPDPLGLPPAPGWLAPVAAAVIGAAAGYAWSAGVRRYQSTGS